MALLSLIATFATAKVGLVAVALFVFEVVVAGSPQSTPARIQRAPVEKLLVPPPILEQ